ncbi:MAG: hypothetical protein G01um10148_1026 [Parcubacteria group bacterium Gr01-1014_8]|nr:MAG: hypothetical protein G01um10148_1026 [Parcubacteria group bacterium Gr01-1014_8]
MEHTSAIFVTVLTIGLFGLIIGLASGYNLGLHRLGAPSIGNHIMSNGYIMKDGSMGM